MRESCFFLSFVCSIVSGFSYVHMLKVHKKVYGEKSPISVPSFCLTVFGSPSLLFHLSLESFLMEIQASNVYFLFWVS